MRIVKYRIQEESRIVDRSDEERSGEDHRGAERRGLERRK